MPSRARITALGAYVPPDRITNDDLSQMVDTSDEWIVQRTGIRERRKAAPDQFTSDLAVAAVEEMISQHGVSVADVDQIIVATSTPDYPFPSVASQVQHRLGIASPGAFDLSAACAGFGYALSVANGLVTAGINQKVLVIGAETMTKAIDYTDRTTCILFGDGAGAALVERSDQPGFLAAHFGTQGGGGKYLYRSGLSTRIGETPMVGDGCLVQSGRDVYKWAVSTVPQGMASLAAQAGVTLDQVDWFVPHSANLRIIEAICQRTGFPLERTLWSLEQYGNTSSASIPLALHPAVRAGRVKRGDLILLYGFGGGLVHSGVLLRW